MNKVILEGYVETEPNIRYFGYQHVRADFTLRTEERFPSNEGEEERLVKLRHNITAWGSVAERIDTLVRLGQRLHIEGRLSYSKQTDQQGETRVYSVIDCLSVEVLSSPEDEAKSRPTAPAAPLIDWASFAPGAEEDPMA